MTYDFELELFPTYPMYPNDRHPRLSQFLNLLANDQSLTHRLLPKAPWSFTRSLQLHITESRDPLEIESPDECKWLHNFLSSHFSAIQTLSLSSVTWNPAVYRCIATQCPNLTSLYLDRCSNGSNPCDSIDSLLLNIVKSCKHLVHLSVVLVASKLKSETIAEFLRRRHFITLSIEVFNLSDLPSYSLRDYLPLLHNNTGFKYLSIFSQTSGFADQLHLDSSLRVEFPWGVVKGASFNSKRHFGKYLIRDQENNILEKKSAPHYGSLSTCLSTTQILQPSQYTFRDMLLDDHPSTSEEWVTSDNALKVPMSGLDIQEIVDNLDFWF